MNKIMGWSLITTILMGLLIYGCDEKVEKVEKKTTYNTYSAEQLREEIKGNNNVILVDIQVEQAYADHHIKGAIKTTAYPVKSDADKAKLKSHLEMLAQSTSDIVIICPRGKGGAKRTYDYFVKNKISPDRLYILEKGQDGWPYKELLEI